jgi:hypothetical protein
LKSWRSVIAVVMMGPVYVHACAVRRAKSANLIGGAPVTLWTLSLGREPMPEAMVSVNIRSILPYSAGTPAATLPWIHTSQSMSLCFAGCQSLGGYRGDQRVWG